MHTTKTFRLYVETAHRVVHNGRDDCDVVLVVHLAHSCRFNKKTHLKHDAGATEPQTAGCRRTSCRTDRSCSSRSAQQHKQSTTSKTKRCNGVVTMYLVVIAERLRQHVGGNCLWSFANCLFGTSVDHVDTVSPFMSLASAAPLAVCCIRPRPGDSIRNRWGKTGEVWGQRISIGL